MRNPAPRAIWDQAALWPHWEDGEERGRTGGRTNGGDGVDRGPRRPAALQGGDEREQGR